MPEKPSSRPPHSILGRPDEDTSQHSSTEWRRGSGSQPRMFPFTWRFANWLFAFWGLFLSPRWLTRWLSLRTSKSTPHSICPRSSKHFLPPPADSGLSRLYGQLSFKVQTVEAFTTIYWEGFEPEERSWVPQQGLAQELPYEPSRSAWWSVRSCPERRE